MTEQTPARDALLGALNALAAVATPATLRRVVHLLVDDQDHDDRDAHQVETTAPPDGPGGAVRALAQKYGPPLTASSQPAEHTTRPAPSPKPTPTGHGKANGKPVSAAAAECAAAAEWARLRLAIRAEMTRRHLDLTGLAGVIGYSRATTENAMQKLSLPSTPMLSKFHAFVAGVKGDDPGAPQEPVAATDGPDEEAEPPTSPVTTVAAANGAVAVPLEPTALKALKAKRYATPLTQHTLAGQLGLADGELARALAGEAVSAAAAAKLAAWATAG
jgi:hypothetical protein